MKQNVFFTLASVFCCILFSLQTASAATVQLSVAASMTDAIKALTADFSATHANIKIQANFASSGALAKQIEQGAPADIYISANQKWMTYLVGKNLMAPDTERIFGYNTLVFIGRPELAPFSLPDVIKLKMIAIGTPESVPAGQYAKQALVKSGLYDTLTADKRLILTQDVRQALIYAERGEVDGAFVYKTDALLAKATQILFSVPDNLYDRVAYPIAMTRVGAENEAARTFFDYLKRPEARDIIARFGFEPAP